jgi:hypothetical protein
MTRQLDDGTTMRLLADSNTTRQPDDGTTLRQLDDDTTTRRLDDDATTRQLDDGTTTRRHADGLLDNGPTLRPIDTAAGGRTPGNDIITPSHCTKLLSDGYNRQSGV